MLAWFEKSGNIFLQGFDVGAEGVKAGLGDGAGGAGLLPFEAFLNRDVTGGREFVDLDAEVAGGGSRLLFDVGEVGGLHTRQERHHGKPQLRMKDRVQFREHGLTVLVFDDQAGGHEDYPGQREQEHLLL